MKSKILLIVALFFLTNVSIGQTNSKTSDSSEVEKVIKGYIENFFTNDYDKMEVFLHERLSKRGVNSDGKLSPNYSKQDLKKLMETNPKFPLKYQYNKVKDVKVMDRVASAVLLTGYPKTRWKEYIHLAKLDGKWIILDVAWCFDKISD
tara:strand:+ start:23195 stop:23641 length:447 start_codon:yes stop_codon:yes gene_type:complete